MKKLQLKLDALAVETFDPAPLHAAERGTVAGNQIVAPPTRYFNCTQTCPGRFTCDGADTCGATCGQETCFQSCYGTCDVTQCMYC